HYLHQGWLSTCQGALHRRFNLLGALAELTVGTHRASQLIEAHEAMVDLEGAADDVHVVRHLERPSGVVRDHDDHRQLVPHRRLDLHRVETERTIPGDQTDVAAVTLGMQCCGIRIRQSGTQHALLERHEMLTHRTIQEVHLPYADGTAIAHH